MPITQDLLKEQILKLNAKVEIVEQTSTLSPTSSSGDLTASTVTGWQVLANVATFSVTPETENDEVEYFSPHSLARVKEPNTTVSRTTMEFQVVNYPPLLDMLAKGGRLSDSEHAAGGDSDGFALFANNDPKIPVGLRVSVYNGSGTLLYTMWFYGNIMTTSATEYNGKIIQPTIQVEVQPSQWNKQKNETSFSPAAPTPPGP